MEPILEPSCTATDPMDYHLWFAFFEFRHDYSLLYIFIAEVIWLK